MRLQKKRKQPADSSTATHTNAAESAKHLLQKKQKVSKKLNYAALEGLFDTTPAQGQQAQREDTAELDYYGAATRSKKMQQHRSESPTVYDGPEGQEMYEHAQEEAEAEEEEGDVVDVEYDPNALHQAGEDQGQQQQQQQQQPEEEDEEEEEEDEEEPTYDEEGSVSPFMSTLDRLYADSDTTLLFLGSRTMLTHSMLMTSESFVRGTFSDWAPALFISLDSDSHCDTILYQLSLQSFLCILWKRENRIVVTKSRL